MLFSLLENQESKKSSVINWADKSLSQIIELESDKIKAANGV